ncbi:MAG: tripartite tricarboxylate transporter TctB family protein [Hyphomicrobiales bacterium]
MSANRALIAEILVVLVAVGILLRDLSVSGLTINSTLWPTILLVLMGITALLLLIPVKGAEAGQDTVEKASGREVDESRRRYCMMAIYAVYVLALPFLGFGLATLLFIPVTARLLGMPLTLAQIAVALATAVGVYLLFQVVFNVPLPAGPLNFHIRWF